MPLVRVAVRCEALPGEYLAFVGSNERGGAWMPRDSKMILETCSQAYPCWTGAWELEEGDSVEFKFVLISNRGFRHERWEDGIRNRSLKVPRGGLVLTAVFENAELPSLPSPNCWLNSILPQSPLHLIVRCETKLGERLVIAGSSLNAGEWSPNSSQIELHTNQFTYPLWMGCIGLATGEQLEFKFVVIGCDGAHHWEDRMANRFLVADSGADKEMIASFDCAETVVRSCKHVRCEAINFAPLLEFTSSENTDVSPEQINGELKATLKTSEALLRKVKQGAPDTPHALGRLLSQYSSSPSHSQPTGSASKTPLSHWDSYMQALPRRKRASYAATASDQLADSAHTSASAETPSASGGLPRLSTSSREHTSASPALAKVDTDLVALLSSWLSTGCFPRSFNFKGRVRRDQQRMTSSDTLAPLAAWDQPQLVISR